MHAPLVLHTVDNSNVSRKEQQMRAQGDGQLVFPALPTIGPSFYRVERSTSVGSVETPTGAAIGNSPQGSGISNDFHNAGWGATKREAMVSKRRKASVPELRSSPMTTVQEILLDSPTIPGHLPGQIIRPTTERSSSLADNSFLLLSDGGTAQEAVLHKRNNGVTGTRLRPLQPPRNEVERRSLLLESRALKPLVIPSTADANPKSVPTRIINLGDVDDVPPKVPPKSPRTESRASPRANSRRPANTADSSFSTSTSTTSATSNSSFRSFPSNYSPRPVRTPIRNGSPSPNPRILDNTIAVASSPTRNESPSRQLQSIDGFDARLRPDNRNESPSSKIRAGYNASSVAPPLPRANTSTGVPCVPFDEQPRQSTSKKNTSAVTSRSESGQKTVLHQRGKSEPAHLSTSVRRPIFKGVDPNSICGLLRTMAKSPVRHDGDKDLPSGFRAMDASANVSEAEVETLKKQAGKHVENFEVLQSKDVSMLSQELKLLDERCAYLQSTHQSLRHGRRNLHIRMITYLKSAHLSKSSLENILKQEEALAELDVSIDEWVAKLDAAEERRAQIRQRLLEHIAAAVTLQIGQRPGTAKEEEPTPPVSPEEDEYICTERRDVQSIKIYADKGVAALLAEIEKEIDSLGDSENRF